MAIQGGLKCVKYLMFLFNIIFLLCGIALIVVGIVVQVFLHKTPVISNASGSAAPLVVIGVGVVILVVSFFGCCGAWKENFCMVSTFAVLVSIIIIVEIAAAIAGYVFRKKVHIIVSDSFKEVISKYKNSTSEFKKGMDDLQQSLHCCGANSSADWKGFSAIGKSVPDSCCKKMTANCGLKNMKNFKIIFKTGCQKAVEEILSKNLLWVVVAALVIAFLQILGVVFACMLMKGIRRGYTNI